MFIAFIGKHRRSGGASVSASYYCQYGAWFSEKLIGLVKKSESYVRCPDFLYGLQFIFIVAVGMSLYFS